MKRNLSSACPLPGQRKRLRVTMAPLARTNDGSRSQARDEQLESDVPDGRLVQALLPGNYDRGDHGSTPHWRNLRYCWLTTSGSQQSRHTQAENPTILAASIAAFSRGRDSPGSNGLNRPDPTTLIRNASSTPNSAGVFLALSELRKIYHILNTLS